MEGFHLETVNIVHLGSVVGPDHPGKIKDLLREESLRPLLFKSLVMALGGVKFLEKTIPFSARLIKGASDD